MTHRSRGATSAVVACVLVAALMAAACSPDGPDTSAGSSAAPAAVSPEDRAVTLRTTGCGDASATAGSGVIAGPGLVLTAAHVVVGSTDVVVDGVDETGREATVVVLDRSRDLALLEAPVGEAAPVELADVAAGDAVRVVGATSGTVAATVERRLRMDVDDVRSTARSIRSGYELDAAIAGGDSGGGVFDAAGRLVGVVFAVPTARSGATFAVDTAEIAAVLVADRTAHRCDPTRSQLTP